MPLKFNIDIDLIKEECENRLENKIQAIKDTNLTYTEKRILVLKEEKTTTYNINDEIDINNKKDNILLMNKSNNSCIYDNQKNSYSGDPDSTYDNSNIHESKDDNSLVISDTTEIKKFNNVKCNYYKKNRLYDIILNKEESNLLLPPKYIIDDKNFGFVYPNKPITYFFTYSGQFKKDSLPIDSEVTKYDDSCYNSLLGLYFCGKNIEIKNEIKKCAPNEFICKNCMAKNKKKYNIKENYLININGRMAKINMKSFHCFGHFSSDNHMIEDCISKFSCNACKLLNEYSEYYL